MITINAPKISAEDKRQLTAHKSRIEGVIAKEESDFRTVEELRAKEQKLRNEAQLLERDAARFVPDAESKLSATQKTLERLLVSIGNAEAEYFKTQQYLFPVTNQAQEFLCSFCKPCHEELLDRMSAALAPFYTDKQFPFARQLVQQASAHLDFTNRVLTRRWTLSDPVEVLRYAKEVIHGIDALVNESEIWSFSGCEVP